MRSLNAHLVEAGSHGHLPFHPGCPVCRAERLAGRLAREPIVSRRAQAALLAAVLALSTGGPAAPIAAAQAPGDEGTASPQGATGLEDDLADPGDEVPLPNEVTQALPVPGGDDDNAAGPVEGEPQEQLGSQTGTPAGRAPGSQGTPPPNVPAESAPAAPAPPPQAVPGPAAPLQATPDARARPERERKQRRRVASSLPAATLPGQQPALAAAPAPDGAATPTAAPSTTISAAARPEIPTGADTYVVRAGDSLWSIAKVQLGPGASLARVAREVRRLWTLNADRIGTGDPSLIMPGQTLRLR